MAVTGLVVPHTTHTRAERLFETYGGFGRGRVRRWYRAPRGRPAGRLHAGSGKFGTGANMAFRREVFNRIGGFDPALDVGTCTNGGGDLEMFFRVLKAGYTLVYEPHAVVRHRHRRTYAELRKQIRNNGIGFYSHLVRTAVCFPEERREIAWLALWWFRWWNLRRLFRALVGKERVPIDLIVVELAGSVVGLFRYHRARRTARDIAAAHATEPTLEPIAPPLAGARPRFGEAVRFVDVARPLEAIADAGDYDRLRVIVAVDGTPVGSVSILHYGGEVCVPWLVDAIAERLAPELLQVEERIVSRPLALTVAASAARRPMAAPEPIAPPPPLAEYVRVSVVVATYDRPDDLKRCLDSLCRQRTSRPLQLIVVDNHPASGVTPALVAGYPQVLLVEEPRGGLSYARNRGIAAAAGEIVATTDDDVVCPSDWIERVVAPFADPRVAVVTGNVLPASLDTDAERLFEAYGGLGRGFQRLRVDARWFTRWRRAVPTWQLGCTANAAFRASIFRERAIGLMDEALGAGTPTGCSEDTYVFYRVLKAGHAIVYEPSAYVWHRHRNSLQALRRQIYAYSKGHVAYHLTTWLRDRDARGLIRVFYELPVTHMRRVYHRLRGWNDYPMRLLWLEVAGNLAGPFALWRARRRVRALGSSTPLLRDDPRGVTDSHVNVPAV
jgi:GT2 family glycosyltransferase